MFDNCEHVIGACAELVDALLRQCRGVNIPAGSNTPGGASASDVTL